MPTPRTASRRNREESRRTNTTERRNRITAEVATGRNNTGDFTNSTAMRNTNATLMQQNFGTRNDRYRDLIAAFGRLRPGEQLEVGNGTGNGMGNGTGNGRSGGLIFSAG